jgi:hypothetical protein
VKLIDRNNKEMESPYNEIEMKKKLSRKMANKLNFNNNGEKRSYTKGK